jgi:hypothetical protein
MSGRLLLEFCCITLHSLGSWAGVVVICGAELTDKALNIL